jgi:pimeloyl-ACP methyl ester carboxylesterase
MQNHGRRKQQKHRRLTLEALEPRMVAAADLAATLVATPLADWVVPGQSLTIAADIANPGDQASAGFRVEYRLSVDAAITSGDLLLGSSEQLALASLGTINLVQAVTVPANVAKGQYFVGVTIVPAGVDENSANDSLAEAGDTDVLLTTLSGTATYNGKAKNVALRSRLVGTPIFDDRPTWIVIHGRNSSPSVDYLVGLASAIDGYTSTDQVLMLDWSAAAASGWIGGSGENYIIPVGAWMASTLTSYGLTPLELNFVGHSWGAYVAAETAERVPVNANGRYRVNSIVALDPAADYPGGSYNPTTPGQVGFKRNAHMSWAFYVSGGSYGSATTAATAHESYLVKGSEHSKVVSAFRNLVQMNYDGRQNAGVTGAVVAQVQLSRLLVPALNTAWIVDRYNNAGSRVASGGTFESVIETASGGIKIKSLRYLSSATSSEVVLALA